jgi:hypothetical protein
MDFDDAAWQQSDKPFDTWKKETLLKRSRRDTSRYAGTAAAHGRT